MTQESPFTNHPIFEIDGAVATITFNRPDKANAMHPLQNNLMRDFLFKVDRMPEVRVVVVKGNGKHFMAGGDLSGISRMEHMTAAEITSENEGWILDFVSLARAMQRLQKPIIASVQGGVAGAAVGLVAACDLVIAAENSFYWLAHILHGGSNDGLVSYFLPRQIGLRKSLELALLGERITAAEAKDIGLINFVVPTEKLAEETDKLVARLASGPTRGYGLLKKLYANTFDNSLEEQGVLEAQCYAGEALHTTDVKEGLKAFFERRTPNFQGK